MKPFVNARAKRNTSVVVLLMWVFALASGVANACLLEARATHGPDAAVGTSEAAIAFGMAAVHLEAAVGHDDDPDPSKTHCVKVCDDASQALVKQPSALDLTNPGLPLLVRVVLTAAIREVAVSRRMDGLLPSAPGLPIRIQYLRLAL